MAASFGEFQHSISDGFSRRFPIGLLAIAAAFFFAYPLTLFPIQGAGVLDAVFAAGVLAATGPAATESLLAAPLIWRALTIAGPFPLGVGALLVWKLTLHWQRQTSVDASQQPDTGKRTA